MITVVPGRTGERRVTPMARARRRGRRRWCPRARPGAARWRGSRGRPSPCPVAAPCCRRSPRRPGRRPWPGRNGSCRTSACCAARSWKPGEDDQLEQERSADHGEEHEHPPGQLGPRGERRKRDVRVAAGGRDGTSASARGLRLRSCPGAVDDLRTLAEEHGHPAEHEQGDGPHHHRDGRATGVGQLAGGGDRRRGRRRPAAEDAGPLRSSWCRLRWSWSHHRRSSWSSRRRRSSWSSHRPVVVVVPPTGRRGRGRRRPRPAQAKPAGRVAGVGRHRDAARSSTCRAELGPARRRCRRCRRCRRRPARHRAG